MRTVGRLKQDGSGFSGSVRTLTVNLPRVRLNAVGMKRGDQSPDFTVHAVGSDGDLIEIGAAWKKTSAAGARYLSISVDDPSFPEALDFAAMEDDAPDAWRILWSRPERRAAA